LNEHERKKIFVLVGPPSVGKSTWIRNTFEQNPYIINRDDIVEQVAGGLGWTYDDLFVSPPEGSTEGDIDEKYGQVVASPSWMTWQPLSFNKVIDANNEVQSIFTERVSGSVPSGQDIVVDMTNMNANARKRALQAVKGSEEDYEKIAVVFEFEGAEELIKGVVEKRAEAARRMGKSKTIPSAAFDRMFKAFEKIDPSEGFDDVVSVDNREALAALLEPSEDETSI
jgi:predicted kinase